MLKIISYRSIGDFEISRQKTMRKSFFFSALILLAATGTHAQDVNTKSCEKCNGQACYLAAIEMHKAKNFGRGADLAQKACDLNYAQGCFYLGFNNQNGSKYSQCNVFYKKACDLNLGVGCLALANNVRLGIGVNPSLQAAMPFYQKACELGEPLGCSHVKNPGFEGHMGHLSGGKSEISKH